MVLYIKNQAFVRGDNYEVFDEDKSLLFKAHGDVFCNEARLNLCDPNGKELVHIEQKKSRDKPTYEISINGSIFATLSKESTWRSLTINVDSKQGLFVVSKDFEGAVFNITHNGLGIGTAKKDNSSWQGAYILTLRDNAHIEFFVAMLLTIDNLFRHQDEQTEST